MVEAPKKVKEREAIHLPTLGSRRLRLLAICGETDQKLLDVFPVDFVEFPGHQRQASQENQDPNANALTRRLCWFTHPLQVIDQVTNGFVVLRWCHAALHFPQNVRHRYIRKHMVVPASRLGLIHVKTAHVGIEIVSTRTTRTRARAGNHRQIWGIDAKPSLGLLRVNGRLHRIANFCIGEQNVFLDLLNSKADVLQAVIPIEGR